MRTKMSEDQQDLVWQIFVRAPFVRSLEIELVSFGAGWCETGLCVGPTLEQQHGFVHAGVLMTLAYHTCGGRRNRGAARSRCDPGASVNIYLIAVGIAVLGGAAASCGIVSGREVGLRVLGTISIAQACLGLELWRTHERMTLAAKC